MQIVSKPWVGPFGLREPELDQVLLVLTKAERSLLRLASDLAALVREKMQDMVGLDVFGDSGGDDYLFEAEDGCRGMLEEPFVLWEGPLPDKEA